MHTHTCHAISRTSSHATYYATLVRVPPHLTHAILMPPATPSHAAISCQVPRHLMHAILTPLNWRNVAESFWTVVHCIRCGRFTDRCGTLRCIAVHCRNVTEGLWATQVLCGALRYSAETLWKGCGSGSSQCIVVRCICCGRLTHHCGTLQCLTVHCGGLHICYGSLVGHCGALWCVVVQCGNIVEGLRTIAAHCGVLYMSWKAYRLLRYLAVPYNALRCTAETLQKACIPLRCIVVSCVHCGRLTNRYGTFRCLMLPCEVLQCTEEMLQKACG